MSVFIMEMKPVMMAMALDLKRDLLRTWQSIRLKKDLQMLVLDMVVMDMVMGMA